MLRQLGWGVGLWLEGGSGSRIRCDRKWEGRG